MCNKRDMVCYDKDSCQICDEAYEKGKIDAIDEYEDMLLEWANNHQCRLDRMDVINIANRLKENKNDNR